MSSSSLKARLAALEKAVATRPTRRTIESFRTMASQIADVAGIPASDPDRRHAETELAAVADRLERKEILCPRTNPTCRSWLPAWEAISDETLEFMVRAGKEAERLGRVSPLPTEAEMHAMTDVDLDRYFDDGFALLNNS